MKQCFKCKQEKIPELFYHHPMMGDKHLGKCKECTKKDVQENYRKRISYYRLYDQKRNKESGRRKDKKRYHKEYNLRDPLRAKAHQMVSNATRDGRLIRKPCEVCGKKAEGHHEDYSKPLEVRWLCFFHHREAHGQNPKPI